MTKQTRLCLAVLALLGSFAGTVFAQAAGSGQITGTVRDPNGLVMPAARVVVRNIDTGIDKTLSTNEAGIYVATFLQPGHYEVAVTKDGFAKVLRTDLTLQVGQILTLDFQPPVESTQTTVTVAGAASVVDTEKTDVSQVVSTAGTDNLPIAGRRWETFVLLTPNTTTDGGTGLVSYRGISGLYNQSAVDGANNTQAFFSESKGRTGVPYVYSLDSIQEFQVSAANYSAELGQAAGGVVNAVTKSGTNMLHGDLFYFLRYPTLNALDPIQKSFGNYTQPVHQQQQFGGSVGGPLIKDKLFFFLTYDGSRKINPISYVSSSSFPQPCIALIPAADCAAANTYAKSLLGAYPRFQNQDVAFGKLDYQVNSKNHVSASFNFDDFHSPNAYSSSTTVSNQSLSQNGNFVVHERIFVANWDSTISSSMFNNFRFQWSQDLEIYGASGTAPSVGVSNVLGYGLANALPRPAFPNEHRMQFNDVLSWTRGRHTIKAGADVNVIHELLINLFSGGGVYTYSGSGNFSNWVADVYGVNLGDGLTGKHYSTFIQATDPVTGVGKDDFYDNDVAGFIEDSWKARPNLTVNLGLRYDVQIIPQPPKPNTLTPLTTYYTSTINIDKNNFGPRIGLAWNLAKNTVLRAGYGIFYGKTTNSTYYATRVENGEFQQTFNCNPVTCPALAFPNVIFNAPGGAPSAPFPGALTPHVTPFSPPLISQTTRGQVPDWVNPQIHEGEATFERQILSNLSVSAGYVFSRGLRLPTFVDSNIAPSTTTKSYDITNVSGATQSTVTVPFYTSRVDPTGAVLSGYSDVNSWYNSMVLTLRKPMSHGLEFTMNYTLSKALDGGQVAGFGGTFNGTDYIFDPKNRKLEWGISDLDQRQRFVGSLVWAPTFAKKISNKAARLALDGFNFSTIVVASSGQPIQNGSSSQVGAQINGFAAGGVDGGLTGGSVNNGGSGVGGRVAGPRNPFYQPNLKNVDFRIGRQFAIRERLRLALVGEAFNLFNFTNIYTVNVTQYNYSAAGSGACAGHTNGCLVVNPTFLAPTSSNNSLSGARQLQISAKIVF